MIPEEAVVSEFDAIAKQIEAVGTMLKVDRWGKKRLAYPISKKSHGEYTVFYYEAPTSFPAEMEKRFRINENILRWLTIEGIPGGIPSDEPRDNREPVYVGEREDNDGRA